MQSWLADAGSVAPHQHRAGLPVDEVEWNISGAWRVYQDPSSQTRLNMLIRFLLKPQKCSDEREESSVNQYVEGNWPFSRKTKWHLSAPPGFVFDGTRFARRSGRSSGKLIIS